jgi:hydrogenase maturation protease
MNPTVVLALGNDILGDDAVGFHAARRLRAEPLEGVDVVESGETGLALLDLLEGYDRALLLDAVAAGDHPPGTILEYGPQDFSKLLAPSPHFAGLPAVLEMAKRIEMPLPRDIRVLAMAIENPTEFREELTPTAQSALPAFVARARTVLDGWRLAADHA